MMVLPTFCLNKLDDAKKRFSHETIFSRIGEDEDNEDSINVAIRYALMIALTIDADDVRRMLHHHGNQLQAKGSQAEAWIQQPPHDMWTYGQGQLMIEQLGEPTKPDENKYCTALLTFQDCIEQTKERPSHLIVKSTFLQAAPGDTDTDQEPRAKTDPAKLKPLPDSAYEPRKIDFQVSPTSSAANWLPSATTTSSTEAPGEKTIEELLEEHKRLKQINLEMKNKQLQHENEKLKAQLEESNRTGGSWPQAMSGMHPLPPFGPCSWSRQWPVPPPGFQFSDGKTGFEVPPVNSQESQSSVPGYSQSYPSSFGSRSFGSSFGTHAEQDKSCKSSADMAVHNVPTEVLTTVMMRNIPNNYKREQVQELLEEKGYGSTFDLLYLPIDFEKKNGLGYAFINFTAHEVAEKFCHDLRGFDEWDANSDKKCDVNWSSLLQGLPAHIERYRNSPVMHESVPDEFKPMLFKDGKRTVFPEPTKKIRPPQQWRH